MVLKAIRNSSGHACAVRSIRSGTSSATFCKLIHQNCAQPRRRFPPYAVECKQRLRERSRGAQSPNASLVGRDQDADNKKGVAYIGGDEAYQRYRRLVLQQSMIEKEREARYASYVDHIDQVESINH